MKLSEILAAREKSKATTSPEAKTPTAPKTASNNIIKVVRTRETPNPGALQFVLNAQILDNGNKSYASKSDCANDEMAQEIFALGDIQSVFVMQNFVTVTKTGSTYFGALKDRVWKTIDRLVKIYPADALAPKIELDVNNFTTFSNKEKMQAVEMVLDRSIRANLAKDGGGVELKGVEGNTVKILYQGACGSCPTSSTGTLQYIQGQLRQQLHPDLEVKSV
jgi:NFU1 iron-sulfur cluster scaffold homolog, mitochondrial